MIESRVKIREEKTDASWKMYIAPEQRQTRDKKTENCFIEMNNMRNEKTVFCLVFFVLKSSQLPRVQKIASFVQLTV